VLLNFQCKQFKKWRQLKQPANENKTKQNKTKQTKTENEKQKKGSQ